MKQIHFRNKKSTFQNVNDNKGRKNPWVVSVLPAWLIIIPGIWYSLLLSEASKHTNKVQICSPIRKDPHTQTPPLPLSCYQFPPIFIVLIKFNQYSFMTSNSIPFKTAVLILVIFAQNIWPFPAKANWNWNLFDYGRHTQMTKVGRCRWQTIWDKFATNFVNFHRIQQ